MNIKERIGIICASFVLICMISLASEPTSTEVVQEEEHICLPTKIELLASEITPDTKPFDVYDICEKYTGIRISLHEYGHQFEEYETDIYRVLASDKTRNRVSIQIIDKTTQEEVWIISDRDTHDDWNCKAEPTEVRYYNNNK